MIDDDNTWWSWWIYEEKREDQLTIMMKKERRWRHGWSCKVNEEWRWAEREVERGSGMDGLAVGGSISSYLGFWAWCSVSCANHSAHLGGWVLSAWGPFSCGIRFGTQGSVVMCQRYLLQLWFWILFGLFWFCFVFVLFIFFVMFIDQNSLPELGLKIGVILN